MDIDRDTFIRMEQRRLTVDKFVEIQGNANGTRLTTRSLSALTLNMHPHVPRTPFTRVAYSPAFTRGTFYRLLQYRFFPDALYLISPVARNGLAVEQVVRLFKEHYFCPLKAGESGMPSHYAPPIRVGSIPTLFDRPVDRCFAWGEGMRMDCTAFRVTELLWIPVEGGRVENVDYPPMSVAWMEMLAAGV